MGALIALIVVGFAMMTLGVALLFLGEVPFVAGKRISAWRSRLMGVILAAFLPVALGAYRGLNFLFPESIDAQAVTWSLFGVCWFLVLVILFRVVVPKREKKAVKGTASVSKNPFGGEAAEKGETKPGPVKKGEKAKMPEPAVESLAWMDAEPEPAPERKPAEKKKEAAKKLPRRPAEPENPFDFS